MKSKQLMYDLEADSLIATYAGRFELPGKIILSLYLKHLKQIKGFNTKVLKSINLQTLKEASCVEDMICNRPSLAGIRFLKPMEQSDFLKESLGTRHRLTEILVHMADNTLIFNTTPNVNIHTYSTMSQRGMVIHLGLDDPHSISQVVELFDQYHGDSNAGYNRRRTREKQALLGINKTL